jgi:single-strand selective monofunctional uracil DNA glycosylase
VGARALLLASDQLSRQLAELSFAPPIAHVYNPLEYARELWTDYLAKFGNDSGQVLLLGMNPGPWGMAQTGVPFGAVAIVRDWLALQGNVQPPASQHPRVPIEGLHCWRNEVSGERLWGWARQRFGTPARFFEQFFVANYCPLCFLEPSGRNRTPDKLPRAERQAVEAACDEHLRKVVDILKPTLVVGVGQYAEERARQALAGRDVPVGRILHPSPASPLANKDWSGQAEAQLRALGLSLP